MWGFWILVFVIQLLRGASFIDLFVIVTVFSLFLGLLMVIAPQWVVISVIIVAHLAWFGMAIRKRGKKPR
jgi:hypothetical protein